MSQLRLALTVTLFSTLAACGTTDYYPGYNADGSPAVSTAPALNYQPGYGVVQTVSVVEYDGARGIGAGAVAGGVVGAILGSQIGSGTGRAAATVAGAGGGAYVGHQIERRTRAPAQAYQLTLRMDDGTVQNVVQDNRAFQVGDRVQVTTDGRVVLLRG
ncbi:MAG: glycine zipper 2TM domain-containing protein [Betaproteobacteria bacterium]